MKNIKINLEQKIMIMEIIGWVFVNLILFEVMNLISTGLATGTFRIIWIPDLIVIFLQLVHLAGKKEVKE
jgi:hypothetical protein